MARRRRPKHHIQSSAALERVRDQAEKHEAKLVNIHERNIQRLEAQYNEQTKLLQHQHETREREIRQSYEVSMKQLVDTYNAELAELEKSNTLDQRDLAKTYEEDTRRRLDDMKRKMQSELEQRQTELQLQQAKIKDQYEAIKDAERQKAEQQRLLDATNDHLEQTTEREQHALDDIGILRARLKHTEQESREELTRLKESIATSKEQLKSANEVILGLQKDKASLIDEVHKYRSEDERSQKELLEIEDAKRDLERKAERHQIDTVGYANGMAKLRMRHARLRSSQSGDRSGEFDDRMKQYDAALREAEASAAEERRKYVELRDKYASHQNRLAAIADTLEACKQSSMNSEQLIQRLQTKFDDLQAKEQRQSHHIAKLSKDSDEAESYKASTERRLHELNVESKRVYSELEECASKNHSCLALAKGCDARSKELQQSLDDAMGKVRNHSQLKKRAEELEEVVELRERELSSLKTKLSDVYEENKALKAKVDEFRDHSEIDRSAAKEHAKLKDKLVVAKRWIEEMQHHHDELHSNQSKSEKHIHKLSKELDSYEYKLQTHAHNASRMDEVHTKLKDEISRCMYPGQKDVLERQLEAAIRERNIVGDKIARLQEDHHRVYKQLQKVTVENEDLKVLQTRAQMDLQQMQSIVTSSAALKVELQQTQKALRKRESELEAMARDLAAVIQQAAQVKQRLSESEQLLKTTTSSEEASRMQHKISECKHEMKESMLKFNALQHALAVQTEQAAISKDKVHSLIQVLKDNDDFQERFAAANTTNAELKEALQSCDTEKRLTNEELSTRIQLADEQARRQALEHERIMQESQDRIAALQQQLQSTRPMAPMGQMGPMPQMSQMSQMPPPQVQMMPPPMGQMGDELIRLRNAHMADMQQREQRVLQERSNTYKQIVAALAASSNISQTQPIGGDAMFDSIKNIRLRGAQREQQAMQDMLKLRSITQKLNTEYRAARQAQWLTMHGAGIEQRQRMSQMGARLGSNDIQSYSRLLKAQQDMLAAEKLDVNRELESQSLYIQKAETGLKNLDVATNRLSTSAAAWPNLSTVQTQLNDERKYTIKALDTERTKMEMNQQSKSAIESQIAARTMALQAMTDAVRSGTSADLGRIVSVDPSMVGKQLDTEKVKQQPINWTVVTNGSPNVVANSAAGAVIMGQQPYTASQVYNSLNGAYATTADRLKKQLGAGESIIVVNYTSSVPNQGVKWELWKNVVEKLDLGSLAPTNATFVELQPNSMRVDLVTGSQLVPGCNVATCVPTPTATDAGAAFKNALSKVRQLSNHIVICVRQSGISSSTGAVYIVDVNLGDPQPITDTWLSYMFPLLQQTQSTKLDLIFNLSKDDKQQAQQMLQTMTTLKAVLNEIRSPSLLASSGIKPVSAAGQVPPTVKQVVAVITTQQQQVLLVHYYNQPSGFLELPKSPLSPSTGPQAAVETLVKKQLPGLAGKLQPIGSPKLANEESSVVYTLQVTQPVASSMIETSADIQQKRMVTLDEIRGFGLYGLTIPATDLAIIESLFK